MDGGDWQGEEFEGSRLAHLAMPCELFFVGHRLEHDC
jgi:hypothetical protein